jgi:hypothetical protein
VDEMDEEIIVVAHKGRRFKCVLSTEEMEQMLARGISWGGLGMYVTMCEFQPDTLFTLQSLMEFTSNTKDEVDAILNEMVNAGYVFRTDEWVDSQPAYVVNRDMLPESITEVRSDQLEQ